MNSKLDLRPLDASFGAIVNGVDLKTVGDHLFNEIYQLWLDHSLLIFPKQTMRGSDQVQFAKRFGELEFDIKSVSNINKDGSVRSDTKNDDVLKILQGNMSWHADSSYLPVLSKGAVFSAKVVPSSGGETSWADMRSAYDALDSDTKHNISNLAAYHSLYYSQSKLGHNHSTRSDYNGYGFFDQDPPLRPLVYSHPETQRKILTLGRHAYGFPGMKENESEAFLAKLPEFACQPPRVYQHNWQVGDVAVWDNRSLLHQARPWDMTEPRIMYQSRIAGDEKSDFAPSPKQGAA